MSATSEFIIAATAKLDGAKDKLKSFGTAFGNLKQVATAVAAAYTAAGAALMQAARQAGEQEQQIERMGFALQQAGLSAEQATPALESFFGAVSRATGFSDEELRESVTLFTQYTAAMGPNLQDITQSAELISSISRQTGRSLSRVAMQVSEAFSGQANALAGLSPGLRTVATEIMKIDDVSERSRLAMEALRDTFEGGANTSLTVYRDFTVLNNEMGDFVQTIGRTVLGSKNVATSLDNMLTVLRTYDARLNDRDDPLAQDLEILIELLSKSMTGVTNLFHATIAGYESASASAEVAFAGLALLWDDSERAQYQYEQAVNRALGAADRASEEIGILTGQMERQIDVSIATERQLSRMFDVPLERVMELQQQMRGLQSSMQAFFGLVDESTNIPDPDDDDGGPRGRGRRGPTDEDRATKAKDTVAAIAEAERLAAEQIIENERLKNQVLIQMNKDRLAEMEAEAERHAQNMANKEAARIAQMKSEAAKEAALQAEGLQQMKDVSQGAVTSIISASQAAFGAMVSGSDNALSVFASGALTGLGQVASTLGSMLILSGAGFSVIPGFQSSSAAIPAGVGLLALGATLGVAGSAVSGGGSRGGSSSGGFSPRNSGFGDFGRQTERQSSTIYDFAGATFVGADPTTYRRIEDGTSRARRRGGIGAEA